MTTDDERTPLLQAENDAVQIPEEQAVEEGEPQPETQRSTDVYMFYLAAVSLE